MVEYDKDSKPQYDLILGTETMKEYGIMLDFKSKTITIDEIILPMRNINKLQGASTLCALKLNHSLCRELYHGTLDVCMVNKVHKYHCMCKMVVSVYIAVKTQQRIFC